MKDVEKFFTRSKASEGRELPLHYPDGTKSDYHLIVRGIDSDEFRIAESIAKRRASELLAIEGEEERAKFIIDSERQVIASLVAGWNFEMEYNHDNVVKLLTEAPQIAEQINNYAGRRSLFFKEELNSSSDGPKQNSN